jgi:hypothetical protein
MGELVHRVGGGCGVGGGDTAVDEKITLATTGK